MSDRPNSYTPDTKPLQHTMDTIPQRHTTDTIQLRYSRAERLKNAPESVRKMYEPDYIPKYGIIKGLTATRASRAVLFSIIVCILLLFFFMFVRLDRTSGSLEGIPVRLETLQQGAVLYTNITFAQTHTLAEETVVVSITVMVHDEKNPNMKQEKTIQAVYAGAALTVPLQFTSTGYTQIHAMVKSEAGHLHLHKTIE